MLFSSLLFVSFYSSSIITFASDIQIYNDTNFFATSRINGGKCSNEPPLGNDGVTQPCQKPHIVSEKLLNLVCWKNKTPCTADVYLTNNCTGPVIATVLVNLKENTLNIPWHDDRYVITHDGFKINFSDGLKQCPNKSK